MCPQKDSPPPGSLIYTSGDHSIYEVDGEEHKVIYPAHANKAFV